jgi:radical SAM protein with 4Fe4S-binding SPASM domain
LVDTRLIDKVLRTPLEVTWTVTSRCNLRCPYCLESSLPSDAPDDASAETRDLIVRELIAAEVLRVYVSGGEPLLVKEVPDYVARLRDSGAVVRLTTNGVLPDEDMADRLEEARLNAAEVSLQPGQAGPVKRALSLLAERDIPTLLRVVVTRANVADLEAIVSQFTGSSVQKIEIQEVVPLGRAASDAARYELDVETLRSVRSRVEGMKRQWGDASVSFTSATLADLDSGRPLPCSLGERNRKSCEIGPDGNVIPCTPATAYGVRNLIPEKGLARCFQDISRLYAPFVDPPAGGRCDGCSWAGPCGGGCRAVSFLLTGKADGGNPVCRTFRAVDSREAVSAG